MYCSRSNNKYHYIYIYFQEVTIMDQTLAIIHPDAFQGLYRLEYLHIDECNLKYSIAFSTDFPNLEHLSLLNGGLKTIPKVSLIADTLVSLILSSNRIASLENIYNIHFPKLSVLNLQGNQINFILMDELELPELNSLSIDDNLIKMIEPIVGILSESGPCSQLYVTLHGNPWHCDTSIMWLKEFNEVPEAAIPYYTGPACRVNIMDDPTLVCKTPLHLEGESLWTAGTKIQFRPEITGQLWRND